MYKRQVHEHGAAAAEIHRTVGKEAEGRKLLDVVAQRLRKGLQKAAAAGGAGFIQEDVADGTILDLDVYKRQATALPQLPRITHL